MRRSSDLPLFLVVSFGCAWLLALPLWLNGSGLRSPLVTPVAAAMMFTPSLGVFAAWLVRRRGTPFREWARLTGLTWGPVRRRTLGLVAATWLGVPLLVLVALAVSALTGAVDLDVGGLSLFRRQLEAAGGAPLEPEVLAVTQLVSAVVVAPLLNAIPSLGEEWGWRGYLLPRLLGGPALDASPRPARLVWRAMLVSGVIWGLWHAPLTLLGYNYPDLGPWAAPMFVGVCVLLGAILGWLRLRTGSVWPAVVGHGAFNASAGLILLAGDAAHPPNLALAGVTGVVGWAVLAVVVVALRSPYRSGEGA
ncbi:CPBP family intramembrane metalloprotease [Microtetraspora sp. AC03309]|uniref:CPBP family intramembrane glutamic endopeptidase n=1 Tax=Microtetraspora sp. AC03309 TaxID=2779376 RepID=UPI001E571C76|nr:CPBP family intramembrane glutamic endopeptidase [Microtetraspora sp. AC03309]MCC5579190.1 CPBP family intramembrane metalloprotease [Microtetraspora sp. AC03309]